MAELGFGVDKIFSADKKRTRCYSIKSRFRAGQETSPYPNYMRSEYLR